MCTPDSNTSFPIELAFPIASTLQDEPALQSQEMIDVQWGTRTTPPSFKFPGQNGILDEVGYGMAQRTTATFGTQGQVLESVQICESTHRAFFSADLASKIQQEVVLTFESIQSLTAVTQIFVVIPLVNTSGATLPNQLQGLMQTGDFPIQGLQELIPTANDSRYVLYQTCLAPAQGGIPEDQAQVILSMTGKEVPETFSTSLFDYWKGDTPTQTQIQFLFPAAVKQSVPRRLTMTEFRERIRVATNVIGSEKPAPPELTQREDELNAQKCVPLDPETQIMDGKIRVDKKTGKPLDQVIQEREAAKIISAAPQFGLTPGKIERYLAISLGVFVAVVILSVIVQYSIAQFRGGATAQATTLPGWLREAPFVLIASALFGIIGFFVGVSLT